MQTDETDRAQSAGGETQRQGGRGAGDQKRRLPVRRVTPGKDEAAAGRERLHPDALGRRRGGVHIDHVAEGQGADRPALRAHPHIGPTGERATGERRHRRFDLIGVHPAGGSDEFSQNGGVISAAAAHMDHALPRLGVDGREPAPMQRRLAVVHAFGGVDDDKRVGVVERIHGARHKLRAVGAQQGPGRRGQEILARDPREGGLQRGGVRPGGARGVAGADAGAFDLVRRHDGQTQPAARPPPERKRLIFRCVSPPRA